MRILFIFLLLSSAAFSQSNDVSDENTLKSNNVSFCIGSAILANGLGLIYQRVIKPKETKLSCFTISGAVNFFRVDFFGASNTTVFSIRGGVLTGCQNNNHFEANLGAGLANVIDESYSGFYGTGGSSASNYTAIYPVGNIGYRFQEPNKNFVFRTGIGFPELLYIGFGVAF
tara:strand:+ start:1488 stop:2003 length:516 start_codon:yes stop_codon:yes gene_type:complete